MRQIFSDAVAPPPTLTSMTDEQPPELHDLIAKIEAAFPIHAYRFEKPTRDGLKELLINISILVAYIAFGVTCVQ